MITSLVFYLFGFILVLSSLLVITAKNPVHSVLFLILAFFNAAGLFVLLGAEFLAFILAIVYVGAVAVLFLFVVMMLDVSFDDLRKDSMQYVPVGLCVGGVLFVELAMMVMAWKTSNSLFQNRDIPLDKESDGLGSLSNTEALGNVMYTDYMLIFQMAGMVLLVAMIGAIVLTLRSRPGVRKQNIGEQLAVKAEDVLEVKKVTSGTGV